MQGNNVMHNVGIASQIGSYSDAVEIAQPARLLILSGTPGLRQDGHLSQSFEEQADEAWKNVFALLDHAGMCVQNLVKVTQYLVREEDIHRYPAIRSKWLGEHRPASMLSVVPALVRPDFLIEIEVIAAAPAKIIEADKGA
jgi:enamine deaminase RidA (YjgF/YER057c/UK114 family)